MICDLKGVNVSIQKKLVGTPNVPKRSGGPAIAAAALRRKSNKLLLFFADSLTNSLSSVLIHSVISACFSAA